MSKVEIKTYIERKRKKHQKIVIFGLKVTEI